MPNNKNLVGISAGQSSTDAVRAMIAELSILTENRTDFVRQLAISAFKNGEIASVFPIVAREVMQCPWDASLCQLAIDLDCAAVDQNRNAIILKQSQTPKPDLPKPQLKEVVHFMDPIYLGEWSERPGISQIIDTREANGSADKAFKEDLNNYLRVSSSQMPGLKGILETVCKRLDFGACELLVDPSLSTYGFTYGGDRCVVVLSRGLIDSMTDEEIAYVIGHELGHHLLGSIQYSELANMISEQYFEVKGDVKAERALYSALGGKRPPFSTRIGADMFALRVKRGEEVVECMLRWRPFRELSCDRVGAIGVGDAETASRAVYKLVIGSGIEMESRFGNVQDIDAFLAQHDESLQLATEHTRKADAMRSHPFLAVRMRALRAFGVALPSYV